MTQTTETIVEYLIDKVGLNVTTKDLKNASASTLR